MALLPTLLFAVYVFGLAALMIIIVGTVSCLAVEHFWCRFNGEKTSISDGSVVITGLLYSLTLPPGLPLWMVCLGAVVAVALFQTNRDYNLIQSLVFAVGAGLGFTLALSLMAGLREKLALTDTPALVQGTAITLMIAGILSLTFMGFAGLGT